MQGAAAVLGRVHSGAVGGVGEEGPILNGPGDAGQILIDHGRGVSNSDPVDAVAQSYAKGVTDEFVEPVVCDSEGTISDNDSIIFFNFRPDRAREITRVFVDPA